MKKNAFLFSFLFLPILLFAQDIHLLNNLQNPMQFNPAATGLVYKHRIATSEEILLGFDKPPVTAQINYEKSIDSSAWGFGFLALYDHIGNLDEEYLEGHIRYLIIDKPNYKWSIGAALIYASQHLDANWFIPGGGLVEDPVLPKNYRVNAVRYSLGTWFKNSWLDAGVSFYGNLHQYNQATSGFTFNKRYTAYLSAKVVKRSNFQLRPDVILLFEEQYNQYVLFYGLNTTFKNTYRAGIKMRSAKSFIASAGVNIQNFSIDIAAILPSKPFMSYFSALQLAYSFH
ncbi:MAG: type IX secretion system membrane protein PorP/SprF [Prolixibacteraceae bacterium]